MIRLLIALAVLLSGLVALDASLAERATEHPIRSVLVVNLVIPAQAPTGLGLRIGREREI